jgi:hypothetical protein
MSEWDRRIREHRVWNDMQALGPTLDSAAGIEGIEPEALDGVERLRSSLAFCGKRLAAADPSITVPNALEEVANGFSKAREEIEQFVSDQDIAHVRLANAQADRALLGVSQILSPESSEELGSLISAITQYRGTVEHNLSTSRMSADESRVKADSLRNELNELAATLLTEQQKLAQVVADYQRQFSEAQEKRGQDFAEAQHQAQQDLAKTVSDYQGQFSAAQDTRGKEFADAQGARQEKFSETVNAFSEHLTERDAEFARQGQVLLRESEERLAGLNTQYAERAETILKAVEEEKSRIEKLVGVIGNLGVTSGYLRNANHARSAMWFWQAITVVAMVVLSVLAFRTLPLLEDSKGLFNWGGFAGRVLLLGSLGVIAAYAGSQADKLFAVEKRNRKMALELEAIGPYLAPLPEEEQAKFRILIGDRSFGRDDDFGRRENKKSPATLLALLKSKEGKEIKELLEAALEFVRKEKSD